MEYTNNTEFETETREQYHARCEERKRLAAERARRQRRQHALIMGGCALLFVGIIGAVVGIHGAVASAHSAGQEETTAIVADAENVEVADLQDDTAVQDAPNVPTESDTIIVDEAVPTEESLTAEVSEFELSEGPAESADTPYEPLNPVSGGYLMAIPEEVISEHAILISLADNTVLADLGMNDRISPASMTKVLTLLTAVENLPETWRDDKFTMTIDITDYSYVNDCSNVGFEVGEEIPIKDLLYGTILPSGADAALGLANYISGSHEDFVELMNQKLADLGISDTTHFTNCVGLYNEDHYTTCRDMAVIMKAAMDNTLCREVLSTHVYTTAPTTPHPDGMILSNWFLRRIEDKDCGGFVVGAKTGFVVQSKCCAVSLAQGPDGQEFICVTAGSTSSWRAIYDQVAIYKEYFTRITPKEEAPAE